MRGVCDILRRTSLFKGLDQSIYHEYCQHSQVEIFYKGNLIAQEGAPCRGIIVILEGKAAVSMTSANGDYSALALLEEGDTFGENLLFGCKNHYQSSLEAATNGKYIFIKQESFLAMMRKSPRLLKNILNSMSDKINVQERRINILSQRSLRKKISCYLIYLLRDQLEDKGTRLADELKIVSTPAVEFPVSKAMAAKLLAVPRPSLSRELINMEEDGLIIVSGRVVWLLNLKELSAGLEVEDF